MGRIHAGFIEKPEGKACVACLVTKAYEAEAEQFHIDKAGTASE
jgi:hypothetical protein